MGGLIWLIEGRCDPTAPAPTNTSTDDTDDTDANEPRLVGVLVARSEHVV
jgi:hypothetical protein